MPFLNYDSYSKVAFEGQFVPEYGNSIYFGIQGQLKNITDKNTLEGRIPYGRVVLVKSRGLSGEYNVALAGDSTLQGDEPVIGVSIFLDTHTKKYRTSSQYDANENVFQMEAGIPNGKKLTVMRRGLIWVYSESLLLPSEPIYFRNQPNSLPNPVADLGRFSNGSISPIGEWRLLPGNNAVIRPNLNPSGGFALINVDIPLP